MDWWEEVPDLASSSNGFLFFGLGSRGLRGCVASPPPRCLYSQVLVKGCACEQISLGPPSTSGQSSTPRREGSTLLCPFSGFAEAHDLLLLRLVEWRCWFKSARSSAPATINTRLAHLALRVTVMHYTRLRLLLRNGSP